MKYLLDTDHCSYLQRAHPQVVSHLRSLPPETELVTSVITQGELLAGIRQAASQRRQEELRRLYEELFGRITDFIPITSEVAEQYADILYSLQTKGKPIPINDIWIAAVARVHDMIVVTSDKHYGYIDGLHLEDWSTPDETE